MSLSSQTSTRRIPEVLFSSWESLGLDYLSPRELAALAGVNRAIRQGIREFGNLFSSDKFPILSRNITILSGPIPDISPDFSATQRLSAIDSAIEEVKDRYTALLEIYKEIVPGDDLSPPASPHDYQAWEAAIRNLKLKIFQQYPGKPLPLLEGTLGARLLARLSENASLVDLGDALFPLRLGIQSIRAVFSRFLSEHPGCSLPNSDYDFPAWEASLRCIYRLMPRAARPNPNEQWEQEDEKHLLAFLGQQINQISKDNLNRACVPLLSAQKLNALRAIFFSNRLEEISGDTINSLLHNLPDVATDLDNLKELVRLLFIHRIDSISAESLNTLFFWTVQQELPEELTLILKSPRFTDITHFTIYRSIGEASVRKSEEELCVILNRVRSDLLSEDDLNNLIKDTAHYDQFRIVIGAHAARQFQLIDLTNLDNCLNEIAENGWWILVPQGCGADILEMASDEAINQTFLHAAEQNDLALLEAIQVSTRWEDVLDEALDTAFELAAHEETPRIMLSILNSSRSGAITPAALNQLFRHAITNQSHPVIEAISQSSRSGEINTDSLEYALSAPFLARASQFQLALLRTLLSYHTRSLNDTQLSFVFLCAIICREPLSTLLFHDQHLEGRLPSPQSLRPHSDLLIWALAVAADRNAVNAFNYLNQWLGADPIPPQTLFSLFFDACYKGKLEILRNLIETGRIAEMQTLAQAFHVFLRHNESNLAKGILTQLEPGKRVAFFNLLAPAERLLDDQAMRPIRDPILGLIDLIENEDLKRSLKTALLNSNLCPALRILDEICQRNFPRKREDQNRPPNPRDVKRDKRE